MTGIDRKYHSTISSSLIYVLKILNVDIYNYNERASMSIQIMDAFFCSEYQ